MGIDGRPFKAPPGKEGEMTGWRRCLLEVLAPVIANGCAWTFVPGNHDDDCSPWSRSDLLGIFHLVILTGDVIDGRVSLRMSDRSFLGFDSLEASVHGSS